MKNIQKTITAFILAVAGLPALWAQQIPETGLFYESYGLDSDFSSLASPDFEELAPYASGYIPRVFISGDYHVTGRNIATCFRGFIYIPSQGDWTFYLTSDDGSRLYLGGIETPLVIDNDGFHGEETKQHTVANMDLGYHPIEVRYFQDVANSILKLEMSGPDFDRQEVGSDFYTPFVPHFTYDAYDFPDQYTQLDGVDFDRLTPVHSGIVSEVNLDPDPQLHLDDNNRSIHFALRFRGYIEIPFGGSWTFYLTSNDGSRLYLGETAETMSLLVDDDGRHSSREKSETIDLDSGIYSLEVQYFNYDGDGDLSLQYSGPGVSKQAVHAVNYNASGLYYRAYNIYDHSTLDRAYKDMTDEHLAEIGFTSKIDLTNKPKNEDFGMRFDGVIYLPYSGEWTFRLTSDDGSMLWVGERNDTYPNGYLSLDNGLKKGKGVAFTVLTWANLLAGYYPLSVDYYQAGKEFSLQLDFEGPGVPMQEISNAYLFQGLPSETTTFLKGVIYKAYDVDLYSGESPLKLEGGNLRVRIPDHIGYSEFVDLSDRPQETYFAMTFEGFIYLPEGGDWTFYLSSDDGSRLYLNDLTSPVIDCDRNGYQDGQYKAKGLTKGFQHIYVEYYQGPGASSLNLKYEGPNVSKQTVPHSALFSGYQFDRASAERTAYETLKDVADEYADKLRDPIWMSNVLGSTYDVETGFILADDLQADPPEYDLPTLWLHDPSQTYLQQNGEYLKDPSGYTYDPLLNQYHASNGDVIGIDQLPDAQLQGAFETATTTIHLSADLFRDEADPGIARNIIIQELAHYYDHVLDADSDEAGAEGILASLSFDDPDSIYLLDQDELENIREKNDDAANLTYDNLQSFTTGTVQTGYYGLNKNTRKPLSNIGSIVSASSTTKTRFDNAIIRYLNEIDTSQTYTAVPDSFKGVSDFYKNNGTESSTADKPVSFLIAKYKGFNNPSVDEPILNFADDFHGVSAPVARNYAKWAAGKAAAGTTYSVRFPNALTANRYLALARMRAAQVFTNKNDSLPGRVQHFFVHDDLVDAYRGMNEVLRHNTKAMKKANASRASFIAAYDNYTKGSDHTDLDSSDRDEAEAYSMKALLVQIGAMADEIEIFNSEFTYHIDQAIDEGAGDLTSSEIGDIDFQNTPYDNFDARYDAVLGSNPDGRQLQSITLSERLLLLYGLYLQTLEIADQANNLLDLYLDVANHANLNANVVGQVYPTIDQVSTYWQSLDAMIELTQALSNFLTLNSGLEQEILSFIGQLDPLQNLQNTIATLENFHSAAVTDFTVLETAVPASSITLNYRRQFMHYINALRTADFNWQLIHQIDDTNALGNQIIPNYQAIYPDTSFSVQIGFVNGFANYLTQIDAIIGDVFDVFEAFLSAQVSHAQATDLPDSGLGVNTIFNEIRYSLFLLYRAGDPMPDASTFSPALITNLNSLGYDYDAIEDSDLEHLDLQSIIESVWESYTQLDYLLTFDS